MLLFGYRVLEMKGGSKCQSSDEAMYQVFDLSKAHYCIIVLRSPQVYCTFTVAIQ